MLEDAHLRGRIQELSPPAALPLIIIPPRSELGTPSLYVTRTHTHKHKRKQTHALTLSLSLSNSLYPYSFVLSLIQALLLSLHVRSLSTSSVLAQY